MWSLNMRLTPNLGMLHMGSSGDESISRPGPRIQLGKFI